MGAYFSSIFEAFYFKKEVKILMLGLDYAGKTTVLYRIKIGQMITTIPTIGFNVETVEHKNIKFSVWDVRGEENFRPLWRHSQGLIFVVDSSDRKRLEEAKKELMILLEKDELRDLVLLVFANKQDLPDAMTVSEITDKLGLHDITKQNWFVQAASGSEGSGLYEGLGWLADQLKKRA